MGRYFGRGLDMRTRLIILTPSFLFFGAMGITALALRRVTHYWVDTPILFAVPFWLCVLQGRLRDGSVRRDDEPRN